MSWYEYIIPLLVASVVLLIFNGDWGLTAMLWFFYLVSGAKNNIDQGTLTLYKIIGIAVSVFSFLFQIIA